VGGDACGVRAAAGGGVDRGHGAGRVGDHADDSALGAVGVRVLQVRLRLVSLCAAAQRRYR